MQLKFTNSSKPGTAFMRKLIVSSAIFTSLLLLTCSGLSFKVICYRQYNGHLNQEYQQRLSLYADGAKSGEEIQNAALVFTGGNLQFALQLNSQTNPNLILSNRKAHCKMYAYVFVSAYNHLAKVKAQDSRCKVAYGQFYWYSINLHQFLKFPFWANHDVCIIQNKDEEPLIVDPVFYDCLLISPLKRNCNIL